MIGISGSLVWSKTLMELTFYHVVNFGEFRRAQLAKSTLLASSLVSLRSFQICMVSSDAKERKERVWGVESNRKLPHIFVSSKTVTLVPEFGVEDLPLSRTAALVPKFAVENLPSSELQSRFLRLQ